MAMDVEFDPFASPVSSRERERHSSSTGEDSDSDSDTDTDMDHTNTPHDPSRLQHVYEALMGSLLPLLPSSSTSHQKPPSDTIVHETGPGTASVVDPKTHANFDIGGVEIATAEGVATGAGSGAGAGAGAGVKNAKRRKMDKKRAKREEQKSLAAEETVDVVGESLLFLLFFIFLRLSLSLRRIHRQPRTNNQSRSVIARFSHNHQTGRSTNQIPPPPPLSCCRVQVVLPPACKVSFVITG